jgi:hypothetical protein
MSKVGSLPQKLIGDVCIHEAGPFVLIEHTYVLSNGQTTHLCIDSENETFMLSRYTLDEIPFGTAQIKEISGTLGDDFINHRPSIRATAPPFDTSLPSIDIG